MESKVVVSTRIASVWSGIISGQIQPSAEDIMDCITIPFKNGFQVDVLLVNGYPPYIDIVLVDPNGHEAAVGDPGHGSLCGEYVFNFGGITYKAIVAATP